MSVNEILGALFLAFFTSNAVLTRSAGLDSTERFSREPTRIPVFAAAISLSSIVSHIISFVMIVYVLPLFGVGASTLADGVVVVMAVLASSTALDAVVNHWLPKFEKPFGQDIFSIGYNSAVAGIVLLSRAASTNFGKSIIYCLSFSASVIFMYYIISVLRSDLKEHRIPETFRGAPILFILLGLAAMVLGGYAGASLPQ